MCSEKKQFFSGAAGGFPQADSVAGHAGETILSATIDNMVSTATETKWNSICVCITMADKYKECYYHPVHSRQHHSQIFLDDFSLQKILNMLCLILSTLNFIGSSWKKKKDLRIV